MQLVVQTLTWSNIFCLQRVYPDMCTLLDGLGTWCYAMRDVGDMGQKMGYCNLEWDSPKEAMNRKYLNGPELLMEPS